MPGESRNDHGGNSPCIKTRRVRFFTSSMCRRIAAFADSASWRLIADKIRRWPARDFSGRPSTCIDLSRVSRSRSMRISSTFSTTLLPEARSYAVMKSASSGNRGFATCKLDLLALQDLFHLRNLVGRSVGRGARRQWRFQHLTKIKKFADQSLLTLKSVCERIDQRVG